MRGGAAYGAFRTVLCSYVTGMQASIFWVTENFVTQDSAASIYLSKVEAEDEYLSIDNAETTYLTMVEASDVYLSISDADDNFLTINDAVLYYLTIDTAESTYLSLSDAALYLTIDAASSQYLSISSAITDYLTIADAALEYLSSYTASITYLTLSTASSTYLSIAAAANTYVTSAYAITTFQTGDPTIMFHTPTTGAASIWIWGARSTFTASLATITFPTIVFTCVYSNFLKVSLTVGSGVKTPTYDIWIPIMISKNNIMTTGSAKFLKPETEAPSEEVGVNLALIVEFYVQLDGNFGPGIVYTIHGFSGTYFV